MVKRLARRTKLWLLEPAFNVGYGTITEMGMHSFAFRYLYRGMFVTAPPGVLFALFYLINTGNWFFSIYLVAIFLALGLYCNIYLFQHDFNKKFRSRNKQDGFEMKTIASRDLVSGDILMGHYGGGSIVLWYNSNADPQGFTSISTERGLLLTYPSEEHHVIRPDEEEA